MLCTYVDFDASANRSHLIGIPSDFIWGTLTFLYMTFGYDLIEHLQMHFFFLRLSVIFVEYCAMIKKNVEENKCIWKRGGSTIETGNYEATWSIVEKIFNYIYTWSVQKISQNFKIPRVTYIRFSIFCGVMLVLISLTYTDKFGHFERSVNFWQLFCLDVCWLVFNFCLFQNTDQRICIKFSGWTGQ